MTPKLNILAQRFMNGIQDPITIDSGTGKFSAGSIIQTVAEIETRLGDAMMKYMDDVWKAAKGNKQQFLTFLPELFKKVDTTLGTPNTSIYLEYPGLNLFDVYDILDSSHNTTLIEVWNQVHLADALAGVDPFYVGDADRPGMILQHPVVYFFPTSLAAATDYAVRFNYIQKPVNPEDGTYFTTGGTYDIPFSLNHINDIAETAVRMYRVDDFQEDAN